MKKGYRYSLTFKTLALLFITIILMIGVFGYFLSTSIENQSKEFLIKNVLIPEFELLAIEKNADFELIKTLTEYTAQKIEARIVTAKTRSSEETNNLFNSYISKKPDGSFRSNLDESKGRYQMAAFRNNKSAEVDLREKGYFVDAFTYFEPFIEGMMHVVHDSYFTTNNFIWEYGAPKWALDVPADETFEKYNWVYEADPKHNPEKKHVWTDMYYDDVQQEWMISSLMPIFDETEYVGTLGQDLILKIIIELTFKNQLGKIGILFYLDNLNNIVAHPDTEFLIGKKAANDERLNLKTLPDTELTKVLQNLPNENGFTFTKGDNKKIVMYFPLNTVHWKMIYVVNEEDFLKIVTQTNIQYLTVFIVFGLLISGLLFFIIRFFISRPIIKLTNATRDISGGNFDKRIDIQSNDEIGELTDSFNQMASNLSSSRKEIEDYNQNLEKMVSDRTRELEQKNKKLETMNQLMIGRELRMIELKKEIVNQNVPPGDETS